MISPTRLTRAGTFAIVLLCASAGAEAQTRSARSARTTTLTVLVTTSTGTPLADATVAVTGPVSRQGTTGADGTVQFQNMTTGTYRCHAEHDGYITLEKEVAVKAGTPETTEASLSDAPAPAPEPPPPAPVAPAPALSPGEPTVVDITKLAEQALAQKNAIVERVIGCSGATSARLYRLNDALPEQTREDTDVMFYDVAGEATLTIGGKSQPLEPGSFGIVPRGTAYGVARRGRNPLILLAIRSGPPCDHQ
jgi:mannose-6-phosphate isomerase-like protein (cupin superfamily)